MQGGWFFLKKSGIVGVVLLVIEILAMISGLITKNSIIPQGNIVTVMGFFLPGVIGVILLVFAFVKEPKDQ